MHIPALTLVDPVRDSVVNAAENAVGRQLVVGRNLGLRPVVEVVLIDVDESVAPRGPRRQLEGRRVAPSETGLRAAGREEEKLTGLRRDDGSDGIFAAVGPRVVGRSFPAILPLVRAQSLGEAGGRGEAE